MRPPRPLLAAIVIGTFVAGCSTSSSHTTSGGACTAVTANAGTNQSVTKHAVVYLNGLLSRSTDGAPLQFSWQIASKPAGSAAALVTAATPTTSFLADLEGTYVVTLTVVGSCTAQATVQIFALNSPPFASASASPSGTVSIRAPVALNGATSWDPNGDPLTYGWTLSKPASSAAALDFPASAQPTFTPDVPGTYQAVLVVSDGSASSPPASVSVTAADLPPIATLASATLAANVANVVAFDASGSSDPDQDTLSFAWTILSKPGTSSAALADATAAVAHLTPDVEGDYTIRVTVSDSAASSTADATLTVYPRIDMLGFRPIDAEYSRSMDRIVMVSASPNALHVHDAIGGTDTSVALPLAPTCVAVSPDGNYAIVGHSAFVSYVNLGTGTLINTFAVSADAVDVILSDPMTVAGARTTRFAYVYPLHDQWSNLHVIDLGTGAETLSTGNSVYAGGRFKLQPGANHVFLVELGLSPQQLYRYDITLSTGAIGYGAQSPYWGDYAMGSNLWISDDGAQILFTSGNRFRTTDMTYAGNLGGIAIRSAFAPASPSAAAGSWIVQPATDPYAYPADTTSDQSFRIFDSTYLSQTDQVDYPKYVKTSTAYPVHGQWVFFDASGTKRIAIVQVDSSASLLNDYGIVVR